MISTVGLQMRLSVDAKALTAWTKMWSKSPNLPPKAHQMSYCGGGHFDFFFYFSHICPPHFPTHFYADLLHTLPLLPIFCVCGNVDWLKDNDQSQA